MTRPGSLSPSVGTGIHYSSSNDDSFLRFTAIRHDQFCNRSERQLGGPSCQVACGTAIEGHRSGCTFLTGLGGSFIGIQASIH